VFGEFSMTIRNVQRVYLGAGVSGFSFDSSSPSLDSVVASSAKEVISGETVGGPDTSKWAELEKHTLATLRGRKFGFSAAKVEI
jgi:hypothetical protein